MNTIFINKQYYFKNKKIIAKELLLALRFEPFLKGRGTMPLRKNLLGPKRKASNNYFAFILHVL